MLVELEFRVLVFVEGEKPENQQQTQPTYGNGPESNLDHIGGR